MVVLDYSAKVNCASVCNTEEREWFRQVGLAGDFHRAKNWERNVLYAFNANTNNLPTDSRTYKHIKCVSTTQQTLHWLFHKNVTQYRHFAYLC